MTFGGGLQEMTNPPKASIRRFERGKTVAKWVIQSGLKVFGSGELVWKTDVFGVLGEFRSGFRSFRAFSSVGRATDF